MEQQNWFYRVNDQQFGPVSREEILNLIDQGLIGADAYVWAEGMADWLPVGQIPDFAPFLLPGRPAPRPTAVTVLGTLNIVFGSLSLLCSPLGIIGILIPQPNSPFQMPEQMKLFSLYSYVLGFVMAAVLLACGIGLLKLKRWARQITYAYGWFAVCWGIFGIVVTALMFGFGSSLSNVSQEAMPAVVGGMVGGMCGGLVGMIYPIFLIVYMRKPNVIQACNQ